MALTLALAPLAGAHGQESDPVDLARITVRSSAGEAALSELVGAAPAIVHFWATWCAPCREELPAVQDFADRLAALGLADRLIVVSVDRFEFPRVEGFLRDDLGLTLDTVQEPNGAAGIAFGLFGYPSTVLLDAGRRVSERLPGALSWTDPEVANRLIAHLEGSGSSE